jgi:hypothetical protein
MLRFITLEYVLVGQFVSFCAHILFYVQFDDDDEDGEEGEEEEEGEDE